MPLYSKDIILNVVFHRDLGFNSKWLQTQTKYFINLYTINKISNLYYSKVVNLNWHDIFRNPRVLSFYDYQIAYNFQGISRTKFVGTALAFEISKQQ